MSCLKATFTPSVSGNVLGLSTAQQIWYFLEVSFKNQFMARKTMLRNQLHGCKKGNSTVLVYLQNLKTIADSLAAIGEKVSESDLVMYVLNGLGREFDSFVISAQYTDVPFTFAERKPRLLNHEQWLVDQHKDTSLIFDTQNSYALYSRNGNNGRNNGYGRGRIRIILVAIMVVVDM
ncbi:uncharacterized protein LOC113339675 [Papaver somniferum]|uniref:uncharacterized protein LOC113339675 n=1 Tax=Papaver somniferum TaxID=3469 RepID=UPI000E6FFFFB|nr:uncharacterized protein LOC113339675 [Papaver somniferum]